MDEPAASPGSHRNPRLARVLRTLLFFAGLGTLAGLVWATGPEQVLRTLCIAAPWLPLVVVLDLGFFACDAMAHRAVLGPGRARIPWSRFVRSTLLFFCVVTLAPLGRAGAELARGAALAPHVGAGRAAAAAANVQGGVLVANFAISLVCWVAVATLAGVAHPLAWLLALNGLATGVGGVLVLVVVRRSRLGRWLGARLPRLASLGAQLDAAVVATGRDLAAATAWCCASRLVQVGMYAALLGAIGASVRPRSALVALGIHLVGAGFGDFVPNQVGILEGAYVLFADALGLAAAPARAMSIALVARLSQYLIAGASLLVLALWRERAAAPQALAEGT